MTNRDLRRKSLRVSLTLHGLLLLLVMVIPWILQACQRRRPNERLMYVEFTVAIPPAPPPQADDPAPAPPKPEPPKDIAVPEKKPDPPPRRDIRQTNRVVRRPDAPPPRGPTLSDEEIRRLLAMGAKPGETTVIPPPSQLAIAEYHQHIRDRMYAAWDQPGQLRNLPGLNTVVMITVEPDGRISGRRQTRSSGNALMDDSVMQAVRSVSALRPLPAGHGRPMDVEITFELTD